MIYPSPGRTDIHEAQRCANLDTVRRVRETVAELVCAERRRRRAERLIAAWCPDRVRLGQALPPAASRSCERSGAPGAAAESGHAGGR
ncbi:hypothetical protein Sme01_72120 [Sphaerisporangium melleum]|uniref:Uncharacterized protein n=1 Tax=Sphaerisporangium melleum TaxID=321316 RepID=A0A917RNV9_9ACTN|nr:hypothetical protein [Sphaerisporangium melleum]GGL17392.1 hypothetical protein GCM10007964_69280 [Sphaerisporangium melleum]GII74736.1 hypothetical protein Sme01_72120 [Sphaerisporangium melleum]